MKETIPAVTFETLTFSDGTTTALDPHDIVIFVGPNNAGKSAALRELEQCLGKPTAQRVIASATLRQTGDYAGVRALLEKRATKIPQRADNVLYRGFHIHISDHQIENAWDRDLTPLRGLFCLSLSTERRIIDSNPASGIAVLDEPPSHPIHLVFADDRIEHRLSGYFRRAFNKDLILFRGGGNNWPFLVGDRLAPLSGEDRISAEYLERLRAACMPLQAQGDGMRSFASVILHLLTPESASILILDEPEAFLHPPQARLLGEFIAKERRENSQLFIATHSPDVLQGLLDAAADHLRVMRIQRDGAINRVKELDKGRTKKIAGDPLMKFSAVMSGIFHQLVVICESDADCMFYNAVWISLESEEIFSLMSSSSMRVGSTGWRRLLRLYAPWMSMLT